MGLFSKYYLLAALVLVGCGGLSVEEQAQRRTDIISAYGGVYADARLARYGSAVLERVRGGFVDAKTIERIGKPQLIILDSDVVSLFAQQQDAIYITRGALVLAQDEAQLAAGLAVALAAKHYSRKFPPNLSPRRVRRADAAGVQAAARAGYHPSAWAKFLLSVSAYQEYKGAAQPSLFGLNKRREKHLRKISEKEIASRGGVGRFTRRQQRYLNAIDGLAFGDGGLPAAGENETRVRGQIFTDTKLGVSFALPQGFILTDNGTRIIAKHKNGLEFVFDMLAQAQTNSTSPLEYLRETWLAQSGAAQRLFNLSARDIAGVAAASGRVGIVGGASAASAGADLLVLAHKDNWLRFALFAPQSLAGQAGSVMRSLTRSLDFNLAATSEKQMPRLRIILVQRGDSVQHLARRMRVGSPRDKLFKIINGLDDNIRAGASVKIIN